MIVYADVVFLVNFIFNAELLVLMFKLQSGKIRLSRLLPAALLGGGLSLVAFIPYLQPYLSAAARYILPFVMSMICFMPCSAVRVIACGLSIFAVSFLFSGMMNFFGIGAVWGFFMIVPVSLVLDKLRTKILKKHKDAQLFYKGNKVTVRGFCDSGNLLMYKGIPVILAEQRVFEELFGKGFKINGALEWIDERDFKYISYSSLGKNGVIPGILIDYAKVGDRVFDRVIMGYLGEGFTEEVILNSIMI